MREALLNPTPKCNQKGLNVANKKKKELYIDIGWGPQMDQKTP